MSDFIRVYIGLMGSGKTTQAVKDVEKSERLLVYSSGSPPALQGLPYIYDTPEYMANLSTHLSRCPRLRVEKRVSPSGLFREMATLRGYRILCDDLPALTADWQERNDFQAFTRTVRYNGNQVVITAHRVSGDIPPLIRTVGTSIYYVGPSHRDKEELKTLYRLVNYPIEESEFYKRITTTPKYGAFTIRRPE